MLPAIAHYQLSLQRGQLEIVSVKHSWCLSFVLYCLRYSNIWLGKELDLAKVIDSARKEMRVLTVDASGGLLIPLDKDIPVKITTELAALLTGVRAQFPSDSASPGVDGEGHKSDDQKFNDISALRAKFDTVKSVSRTTYNIWIVCPKGEGDSFSADAGTHSLWYENASDKQALTIPARTDLSGCGNAVSNIACFFFLFSSR